MGLNARLALAAPAALLGLALASATPPAVASARARPAIDGAPLPGWWRYETAMISGSKVEEKCIGPDQISKVLDGPSNSHYACDYPVREVGAGHARFEGTCTERKHGGTVPARFTGTYGPTRFDLKGVVEVRLGVVPFPLSATVSATRLSATCPGA